MRKQKTEVKRSQEKSRVIVNRVDVFNRVKNDKTDLSKLDYALVYASMIFQYDDVISITIK
jgi:hypothetical protein